uniref:C-type lectin domain-containing protein n=1 Tax=Mastacembelus armatus TaxID=205130 RepID=A0A3Q3M4H4_9TELE
CMNFPLQDCVFHLHVYLTLSLSLSKPLKPGHFFTVQLFYQVGRSNNKTSFFGCCCSGKKTGADQYIVNSKSMGWTTARDYCRTYYTDLASLRNNAENQMIQNVSGQMTVWLGLFRDIWKWSDQTYSSMRYWKADQSVLSSTVGTCGALLKSVFGKWGEVPCGEPHPFICDCSKKDLLNFLSNK